MCLAAGTCTDALHLSVVFWTFLHGYHGSFATHDHSGPRMVYTWDNAERFNAHSIRSQNLWSSSVNIQLFFKDYHHHPLGYSNTIQGGPPSCKLLYNCNELLILPTILHRFHPAICIKLARGKTYLDLCFNPKPGV